MVQLRSRTIPGIPGVGKERHVVLGGGGYAGYHLGKALAEKGHDVVLFDVRQPDQSLAENMKFVKGDIRELSELEAVIEGSDCVYHLASYGMSGREQLNRKLIEAVNVTGTDNVLKACQKHGVSRLVYTSTYNVVFGGQEIMGGDETLPYLPMEKHPDHYSRTKAIAEMAVLKANGSEIKGGRTLKTCALRLAGVYGPGEQRHLPRVVSYIEQGLFCVVHGTEDSQVDFLHIENFVQAHILAGVALSEAKECKAAGQAYFISDGKPINNFEFFRPLVEGLGYTHPTLRLPVTLVYYFAFLTEMVHFIVGRVYNFQPLLTRTEVYKTGVTHHFKITKAEKDLGYKPTIQNDLTDVVKYFRDDGHGKTTKQKQSKYSRIFIDICIGLIFALLVMSFLPSVK